MLQELGIWREVEICRRLLQFVLIQEVEGSLRKSSIHCSTYLASVCVNSLPTCRLPSDLAERCTSRQELAGTGLGQWLRCHVGRGTSSLSLPRGLGLGRQLFLHRNPFNSSHPKSYLDTYLIEQILFGSQELLHLWEKPLGKGSVYVLILHSSPTAAQQSLLTGNSSSVGYRVALGCFSLSSHEAAVTNSTMWCEVVSLLRSLGSAVVSCKCI